MGRGVLATARFVFGIIGNVTSLSLFLVPMFTFKRIIKNKTTEQFSGIPYVMTVLNCLLSAWYGLPFITTNNILVVIMNGVGAAIEIIYVIIFVLYAPCKQRRRIVLMLVLVILSSAATAITSVFAFHGEKRRLFCGIVATVVTIFMYASPLSVIRQVITKKSVEYMPFSLSFAGFISCCCWFIYAMLGMDLFIGISTGVGLVLGVLQLILYFIYKT